MANVSHEVLISTLKKVKKLLARYQVQYFLIGGSAIGAVREHGMIPWDDDIDIGIKRENIQSFIAAFNGAGLDDDLRLVKPGDPSYFFTTYKVLNHSEAVMDEVDAGTGLRGVFIDVFALDKTFAWKPLRRLHQLLVRIDEVALDVANGDMSTGKHLGFFHKVAEFIAHHRTKADIAKMNNKHIQLFNWLPAGYIYYNFSSPYPWDREYYRRDEIAKASVQTFENAKFPVAAGYDAILTRMYGDYMQPPKEADRKPKHLQAD
ncbi:LicD family protein [Lacticaseibacillus pabuli]|uniref:LicD family protein n=1 Tax=Lacticaseibacillus pabuli TaxID=3025672 RepID=A0ABY7WS02_9LACO|nr:LicD family protein [Lacticaseibacillus sp. KACC 23028]WDF82891.1 LicD family protein [Lacticaseibacillus sp. KACC 23028]